MHGALHTIAGLQRASMLLMCGPARLATTLEWRRGQAGSTRVSGR